MESERLKKSTEQEVPMSVNRDEKASEPFNQRVATGERFPMIAKTLAELEDVLAEELVALGAEDVEIGTRMASFTGDKALMYKANLHCRTALRILKPIYNFKANSADEVYEAIKGLNWEEWLSLDTRCDDRWSFAHLYSLEICYLPGRMPLSTGSSSGMEAPSVSITNFDIALLQRRA